MRKKLKIYLEKLSLIEYSSLSEGERIKNKKELFIQIQFFQHERMIHLIVTSLFALLETLSVLGALIVPSILLFSLVGLFLILLIPYIYHYYILENGVQRLYVCYEKLNENRGNLNDNNCYF